jgi:hypothetical protein
MLGQVMISKRQALARFFACSLLRPRAQDCAFLEATSKGFVIHLSAARYQSSVSFHLEDDDQLAGRIASFHIGMRDTYLIKRVRTV